jgi:AAA+ ATPase superfamily predicted ATPase
MSTNKDLFLEDGTTLKWFPKSKDYFFNKTTIVYGRRESGKSTIVKEIMYMLQHLVSVVFIVSQSSVSNTDFVGKVPRSSIKSGITKEWIEEFLDVQKGRAELYNKANDVKILKSLFNKIKISQEEDVERHILLSADKYVYNIENNPKLDYASKKEQITEIQSVQVKKLVDLYKSNIRANKHILDGMIKSLSIDEICCLNYLDFQPHALLIFDDCASVFKKWSKESTSIKEIFYNGRWYYITIIITAQDDKEIDPELRKNSMVSFFTSNQAATSNFSKASNAYPKHEKIRSEKCIKKIFHSESTKKNFKKLVYVQNSEDPFMYTIADICEDFRVGAPSMWSLDDLISANKDKDNNESVRGFLNRYGKM